MEGHFIKRFRYTVGGYRKIMEFSNTTELIKHLKLLGKVVFKGSTIFYYEDGINEPIETKADSEAVRIARKLARNVKEKFSFVKVSEKDIVRWAEDIDKINRLDGYKWSEIEWVVEWVKQDSFWCQQIRSGGNLRKKFETLKIRIQSEKEKSDSKPKPIPIPKNNMPKTVELTDEQRKSNLAKIAEIRKEIEERRKKKAQENKSP